MNKFIPVVIALSVSGAAIAGWQDLLQQQVDSFQKGESSPVSSIATSALSQEDMITGLKQALEKGVGFAVDNLGQPDGFLGNADVRIPMPDQLQQLESLLRKLGQDALADQFVTTMNRAAEQAVPLTRDVLVTGVQQMTIEDAKNIVSGPDDAATSYLRKTGGDQLRAAIEPIVKQATDQAGVTSQYKSLFNNLGFMGSLLNPDDYDIDKYVTDKTMDGLFTMIAEQEKMIRENPVERTTNLLKQVFAN